MAIFFTFFKYNYYIHLFKNANFSFLWLFSWLWSFVYLRVTRVIKWVKKRKKSLKVGAKLQILEKEQAYVSYQSLLFMSASVHIFALFYWIVLPFANAKKNLSDCSQGEEIANCKNGLENWVFYFWKLNFVCKFKIKFKLQSFSVL